MKNVLNNVMERLADPRPPQDHSEKLRAWAREFAASGWWHSFELPDGRRIEGVNPIEGLKRRLALFPIADDLTGKRVLDIGAWDGWFSFEMERRGAEVVAVDCVESQKFREIHRILGSKIDYRILDVYELTPERLGYFDIVLFLGVLYHLKHPLLALERVCALTRDLAVVETYVSIDSGPPAMQFFETDELGGQFDNWVGPNVPCALAWCRTAGFARADLLSEHDHSAAIACYRRFAEPAGRIDAASHAENSASSAPDLRGSAHMVNFGINFSSVRDEYVSCWFQSDAENLNCDNVQAKVGHLDSRPVLVKLVGEVWQINFKLPPGLEPGWHPVRVRLADSEWSNATKIALDLPLTVQSLAITGACDGTTWKPFEVDLESSRILTIWLAGLPENCGRNDIRIAVGGDVLNPEYLAPWAPDQPSQINALLPADADPGKYAVTVTVAGVQSKPATVTLLRTSADVTSL